ncbi:hypothetical protein HMI55_000464 [Coelomomyces lativittatus]|nr:hypothetical protein HMI55_000464 [Coelomomyces lativittatus]
MPSQHPWCFRNIGLHPKIPQIPVTFNLDPTILSTPIPKLLKKNPSNNRLYQLVHTSNPSLKYSTEDLEFALGVPQINCQDDLVLISKRYLSDRQRQSSFDSSSKPVFKNWMSADAHGARERRSPQDYKSNKKRYKYFTPPVTNANHDVVQQILTAEKAKENVKQVVTGLEHYLFEVTQTHPSESFSNETSVVDTVMSMIDPMLKTSESDKPTLFLQPEEDAPAELLDYIEKQICIQV